jgi:hypothetical protein
MCNPPKKEERNLIEREIRFLSVYFCREFGGCCGSFVIPFETGNYGIDIFL